MPENQAVAEVYCRWAALLTETPDAVSDTLRRLLIDAGGLMVASRRAAYVRAAIAACDTGDCCTVIGHERGFTPADAALVSGIAIHGEDYDDTFEGTPVHVGAVIVPAVLTTAEAFGCSGREALKGMAVGAELTCRMALVAPTAIHSAGFHPTAVIGAMGAAAGVAATLGLPAEKMVQALGIAGSMASGIIEYLAEGTWTKRLHPGWAAQAGIKAARLARGGFTGPRTVLDGTHGFYKAFADPSVSPDYGQITDRLGEDWHLTNLAFKPYACGTMIQPFVDCAIGLRGEISDLDAVEQIVAQVAERTVHRLWEPRAEKIAPSTAYSAKFSGPFGIAIGLLDGSAGLDQFTEARISDPKVLALTAKVKHQIDPGTDYPQNYSGELSVRLADGRTLTRRQPHLRGGVREPLSNAALSEKFRANAAFGGWPEDLASDFLSFTDKVIAAPDLSDLKRFRR